MATTIMQKHIETMKTKFEEGNLHYFIITSMSAHFIGRVQSLDGELDVESSFTDLGGQCPISL